MLIDEHGDILLDRARRSLELLDSLQNDELGIPLKAEDVLQQFNRQSAALIDDVTAIDAGWTRTLALLDQAILACLLEHYQERLLAMLRGRLEGSRLQTRHDAHDIVQNVFLTAGGKWPKYLEQPRIAVYPWLYRVACDEWCAIWKRENRDCRSLAREVSLPESSSVQLGLDLVQSQTSPSQAVCREEQREHMKQILELLDPQDREILWMRNFDNLSVREIAEVLEIDSNTASQRCGRALRKLRRKWKDVYGEIS